MLAAAPCTEDPKFNQNESLKGPWEGDHGHDPMFVPFSSHFLFFFFFLSIGDLIFYIFKMSIKYILLIFYEEEER